MANEQERRILNLADNTVNQPSAIEIARRVAHLTGLTPEGEPFNQLRRQLAYAYAQGYIRGLDTGRLHIVRLPLPPTPREQ